MRSGYRCDDGAQGVPSSPPVTADDMQGVALRNPDQVRARGNLLSVVAYDRFRTNVSVPAEIFTLTVRQSCSSQALDCTWSPSSSLDHHAGHFLALIGSFAPMIDSTSSKLVFHSSPRRLAKWSRSGAYFDISNRYHCTGVKRLRWQSWDHMTNTARRSCAKRSWKNLRNRDRPSKSIMEQEDRRALTELSPIPLQWRSSLERPSRSEEPCLICCVIPTPRSSWF